MTLNKTWIFFSTNIHKKSYWVRYNVRNNSLKESNILGNVNFLPPFKFCMQLGTQGECTKTPLLKVTALLLP